MLIALEGVDGSGKSSLASVIADIIRDEHPYDDVECHHAGPLQRPVFDEYVHSLSGYTPGAGLHIVMDRWHYGETVYGPVYRGGSAFTTAQWRWAEHYLGSRGLRVSVVTNSLDEIKRRLEERGEDFLQPEHVAQVIEGFNAFSSRTSPTFAQQVVVGDSYDIEETARRIILDASVHELYAKNAIAAQASISYVGPLPGPELLLVGEKRGGIPPFVSTGAFMPYRNNSADYLWSALSAETWLSTGVINAKEEPNIARVVQRLGPLRVVALGREASKVLSANGIPHGTAPHPQWVRRFKNKHSDTYADIINQAARTQEDLTKWPK